ncbi:MAG: hypothetical protein JWM60_1957 [Solirubrobacterales bacterium]|nr:hypothetical protein [Solirubrobacterales bacterium]
MRYASPAQAAQLARIDDLHREAASQRRGGGMSRKERGGVAGFVLRRGRSDTARVSGLPQAGRRVDLAGAATDA